MENFVLYDALRDFSVWLRAGSYPADFNRFRSHDGNISIELLKSLRYIAIELNLIFTCRGTCQNLAVLQHQGNGLHLNWSGAGVGDVVEHCLTHTIVVNQLKSTFNVSDESMYKNIYYCIRFLLPRRRIKFKGSRTNAGVKKFN